MKNIFKLFLLLLSFTQLLFSSEISLSNKEKEFIKTHQNIKIAHFKTYAPLSYLDKQNKPIGYMVDYLKLISEYTGLNIKLETGTWAELFDKLNHKKIDVLPMTNKTKQRKEFMLFSHSYLDNNPMGLFGLKDAKPINSISQLKGKKISIINGWLQAKYIKETHPEIELITVKDTIEGMETVLSNKADYFLARVMIGNHYIKRNLIFELHQSGVIRDVPTLKGPPFHFAIRKDWPELLSIINKGMEAIPLSKLIELYSKWSGNSPHQDSKTVQLNITEQKYLNQKGSIQMCVDPDWMPYEMINNEGKHIGIASDLIKLIQKRTGMDIKLYPTKNWSESIQKSKEGKCDILSFLNQTPERDKWLKFTKPIYTSPRVFITHEDHPLINDPKKLLNKTIVLPKGYSTVEIVKSLLPNLKITLVKTEKDALEAVSSKKAHMTLASMDVAALNIRKAGFFNLKMAGTFHEMPDSYSIGVIKSESELIPIFNKTIEKIIQDEINTITNKYISVSLQTDQQQNKEIKFTSNEKSYLSSKNKIDICVDPDWLPFEKIDEHNNYEGIGSDIIEIVSKKINKPINLIQTTSWTETVEMFLNKKCDLLPVAAITPNRKNFMNFTRAYVKKPLVVATKEDQFFIQDSSDLIGKKIGVVENYAFIELLKQKQPGINIITVKNTKEGLDQVKKGKLFGFVDALPTIAYIIQKEGMLSLKIAGRLEFDVELSIASQKDEPLLNSIIQKALDDIKKEHIDSIIGKWISIKIEQSFDYKTLLYIVAFFLIILALILHRNLSINKLNKKLEKSHDELEEKNRLLEQLSITDNLTKLYNRNRLDDVLEDESNRANRFKQSFGVILLDVDHFKSVNDIYGHQMGDTILKEIAQLLKEHSRKTDTVGRWGGEEFLIICSETDMEGIKVLAEKLREKIATFPFSVKEQKTASFGISLYKKNEDIKELIKRADEALYNAKANGRNTIESL